MKHTIMTSRESRRAEHLHSFLSQMHDIVVVPQQYNNSDESTVYIRKTPVVTPNETNVNVFNSSDGWKSITVIPGRSFDPETLQQMIASTLEAWILDFDLKMTRTDERHVGERTPWGSSDSKRAYNNDVVFFGTPSHGGYKLSRKFNSGVDKAWRISGGWYEEDCNWAIVALTFPYLFTAYELEQAHSTAKNWFPLQYEAVFDTVVPLEESHTKRRVHFEDVSRDSLVVTSASTISGTDMVKCYAVKGGNRDLTGEYFVVPQDEYAKRGEFGFIIDEGAHQRFEDYMRETVEPPTMRM